MPFIAFCCLGAIYGMPINSRFMACQVSAMTIDKYKNHEKVPSQMDVAQWCHKCTDGLDWVGRSGGVRYGALIT